MPAAHAAPWRCLCAAAYAVPFFAAAPAARHAACRRRSISIELVSITCRRPFHCSRHTAGCRDEIQQPVYDCEAAMLLMRAAYTPSYAQFAEALCRNGRAVRRRYSREIVSPAGSSPHAHRQSACRQKTYGYAAVPQTLFTSHASREMPRISRRCRRNSGRSSRASAGRHYHSDEAVLAFAAREIAADCRRPQACRQHDLYAAG